MKGFGWVDILCRFRDRLPWASRSNPKPNLGLWGDGDDVEIIEIVEAHFEVAFTDAEVEAVQTVGDWFDLLLTKRPDLRPEAAWNDYAAVIADFGEHAASDISREMEFFREVR
jgi:hypothetical protein